MFLLNRLGTELVLIKQVCGGPDQQPPQAKGSHKSSKQWRRHECHATYHHQLELRINLKTLLNYESTNFMSCSNFQEAKNTKRKYSTHTLLLNSYIPYKNLIYSPKTCTQTQKLTSENTQTEESDPSTLQLH